MKQEEVEEVSREGGTDDERVGSGELRCELEDDEGRRSRGGKRDAGRQVPRLGAL